MKGFKHKIGGCKMRGLIFILTGLLASTLYGATSATLMLSGVVLEKFSLELSAISGVYDNLDLSASPVDLQVATVNEKSNSLNGYKILISSSNAGKLVNSTVGSLDYSLTYDGQSVPLQTTAVLAKSITVAGAYNNTSSVNVTYTGKPVEELPAGSYADTVTFTIQAN